jgi:predicted nucleotidyltransferase
MEVRSVEAIVRALNTVEVQYLIVGGLAVNAYGYERLTQDVDLVIGLAPDNIVRGLRALSEIAYRMPIPITPEQFADATNRETWQKEKNMTVLRLWSDLHRRTPVYVFVYEPFHFAEEYTTAKWEEISAGVEAPIVRCETLIAMKRFAARPQDLADIAALGQIQKLREAGEGG